MSTPAATCRPGTEGATAVPGETGPTSARAGDLRTILAEVERDLLTTALRESRGNKAKAARSLGITERLMGIRVARLGIDWRSLRVVRARPPRDG